MKPTMPMNAYPPGGPPQHGGPPSSGGWGPPPGGPPHGGFPAGEPPKKSKTGLFIGAGCGCLVLVACLVGGGVFWGISALGPGEEVQSVTVTAGQPFSLAYVQDGSQRYQAWMEIDLAHTGGYSLSGPILLSENDIAFGQYTLAETGSGSPVTERSSSTRINWVHTNSGTSGTTALFPIPAKTSGATVTLSGTIQAPPGTTGTIRLFVSKRD